MKERLAHYISNDLLNQRDLSIADDEDLLGSGLLDSLSVMSLVHFMEETFAIEIPAEDVVIEHFMTLSAIEAYVERRRAE